jgi:VWA domain-containing protein
MGRHATPRAGRRLAPAVLAGTLVLAGVAGPLGWWVAGRDGGTATAAADCTRTPVRVTVAPELRDLVGDLLADPQPLADGACAVAEVTGQEPLQTVADLGALGAGSLPEVWVPDSSLWVARAGDADLDTAGSVATSPLVLATSSAAADSLGWSAAPPSWGAALTTGRPVAVPDLAASAEGLSALAAVRASLGSDPDADNAIVQAVLAAERAKPVSPTDALAAGAAGSADAPLVPVSEQDVLRANQGTTDSELVAVYPSEGTPYLDYPVLRVGEQFDAARDATDAVVQALSSPRASALMQKAGFRGTDLSAPPAAGEPTGTRQDAPTALTQQPADVQGLLARLSALAKPSRLLAVFDVSTSMRAPVGTRTRATLARDAAKSALALFPDNASIGLWVFARKLDGDADWVELAPTRPLAASAEGAEQRDVLTEQLDQIPGRLAPGGTGLYDTTLAAVRAARADYDPTAVNSVVLVTDGKDEDEDTIGLPALLQTLTAEVDPTRPVKVIGIALGPDADRDALQQIAAATGGAAYSAVDENDLQAVLFDALRQRG